MVMELINLNEMIQSNIYLYREAITERVALHTNLDSNLPLIEADRSQLQQLIMNLVLNGAEAIEGADGTVEIATAKQMVTAEDTHFWYWTGLVLPAGEYVSLMARDSGIGMSPETKACVFDPFFTTKDEGQGMGLAAVLGVVRDHQGGLHVESQLGKGTMFQLLFPIRLDKETAVSSQTYASVESSNHQLILVIDDEEAVRDAVTDIMAIYDIDVITAVNGQEGIDLFAQRQHDVQLILLDMSMPGLNGVETLGKLRELDPKIRIILSSGYSQQQIADEVTVGNYTGFLPKPYDIAMLINKVRQYLPGV